MRVKSFFELIFLFNFVYHKLTRKFLAYFLSRFLAILFSLNIDIKIDDEHNGFFSRFGLQMANDALFPSALFEPFITFTSIFSAQKWI